jgi:hypothetical protein
MNLCAAGGEVQWKRVLLVQHLIVLKGAHCTRIQQVMSLMRLSAGQRRESDEERARCRTKNSMCMKNAAGENPGVEIMKTMQVAQKEA